MRGSHPAPPINRVLDALTAAGCRWRASEAERDAWNAQCPAHDDRSPSLLITRKPDGKVLLYCRAMCDTLAVIRALGLEWSDLWEHNENDPSRDDYVRPSRRRLSPDAQEAIRLINEALRRSEAA